MSCFIYKSGTSALISTSHPQCLFVFYFEFCFGLYNIDCAGFLYANKNEKHAHHITKDILIASQWLSFHPGTVVSSRKKRKWLHTVTLQNCIVLHFVQHHLLSIIPAAKWNHFCIHEEHLHIFKQTFAYCKREDLLPSALLVVKQMHRAYNAWRNCSKAGLWLKWQIVYLLLQTCFTINTAALCPQNSKHLFLMSSITVFNCGSLFPPQDKNNNINKGNCNCFF